MQLAVAFVPLKTPVLFCRSCQLFSLVNRLNIPYNPLQSGLVDAIKILGVTVTNTLSVNEHVSNVISSCSQSVHALRILRTHGVTAASVHIIFKSVVVAKLVYAASSWWGFATADDRKRLQAVIRRGIRSGLCQQHHKTVEELVEGADDKLFTNVMYNKQHVLHFLVPRTQNITFGLDPITLK